MPNLISAAGSADFWKSRPWLVSAALFLGAFISRIPFRTTMLYAWDSVLYTRAIAGFDVTLDRPQPPGHLFYVGAIWLFDRATGDPNAAMVWISTLAGSAAVAALYLLGRRLFGHGAGLLAALLLATSLTFWVYSEVAYPYTLLGLLAIVCAAAIWRTWEGSAAWVIPAAAILGVAGGFREDLLPFMLPLLAAGLWRKPLAHIAGAVASFVAMTALWYIPAALMSGGLSAFRAASSKQTDYLLQNSSVMGRGFDGLVFNLREFSWFLLCGLSAAIVLAAWSLYSGWGRRHSPQLRALARDRRFLFLSTWILPAVVFYIFVHIGEYGYVFSFLPALILLLAWWATAAVRSATGALARARWRHLPLYLGGGAVAANLVLFLFLSPPFSATRLAARDGILRSKIETIRANFDPSSTLIIAVFDEQQVEYYLPDYRHLSFDAAAAGGAEEKLEPGIRNVVVFEEYLRPADESEDLKLPLDWEMELHYMSTKPGQNDVRVNWDERKVYLESR